MALKLINREEVTENGEVFITETYVSDITGKETVVKHPKTSEAVPETEELTEPVNQTEADMAYMKMMLGGE